MPRLLCGCEAPAGAAFLYVRRVESAAGFTRPFPGDLGPRCPRLGFILSGAIRGFEQGEPKSQGLGVGLFCSSPQESPHPTCDLLAVLCPRVAPARSCLQAPPDPDPPAPDPALGDFWLLRKRSPLPCTRPLPCIRDPAFSWGAVSTPSGCEPDWFEALSVLRPVGASPDFCTFWDPFPPPCPHAKLAPAGLPLFLERRPVTPPSPPAAWPTAGTVLLMPRGATGARTGRLLCTRQLWFPLPFCPLPSRTIWFSVFLELLSSGPGIKGLFPNVLGGSLLHVGRGGSSPPPPPRGSAPPSTIRASLLSPSCWRDCLHLANWRPTDVSGWSCFEREEAAMPLEASPSSSATLFLFPDSNFWKETSPLRVSTSPALPLDVLPLPR